MGSLIARWFESFTFGIILSLIFIGISGLAALLAVAFVVGGVLGLVRN